MTDETGFTYIGRSSVIVSERDIVVSHSLIVSVGAPSQITDEKSLAVDMGLPRRPSTMRLRQPNPS